MVCMMMLAAVAGFRAPVEKPVEHERGFLWIEAESFAEYGSWEVDTQFTHKMGSAYLICPGADRPTKKPARTEVAIPRAGTWRAWARTKDWLPEFSPGKFALEVNGRRGATLGASKKGWGWENAGDFELPAGKAELTLRDLSGAYARCDAILLTTDLAYVPPEGRDEARPFRRGNETRCGDGALAVADGGTYDVVVVGAGPGGMGASLGAARNGAQTALVFDRPVPGGNASSECGIGFDGASLGKKNARESGVVEEIRLTRNIKQHGYSQAFETMAKNSPGLSLFRNERVMRVEKDGTRIAAVISRNTLTGRWTRWRGRLFVDSTGDGWIGYFAGARTMYGREAGAEYGEEWIAPKTADRLTMSGTLSTGLSWRTDREQPYETPVWARVLPKGFDRKIPGLGRPWWLEAPGRIDDLEDPEAARDHLIRICFAYWGYVRNEWPGGPARGVSKYAFTPPSIFNGRREGMRIVGDYVLTANDCKAGRRFPDAVTYGGWSLDTHDPLGMDNPHGDGWWHPHMGVPIYTVPFRSLYSADVLNLLIGSRCQSMTHIALGSMRVQGTQMAAGQAAGTAAALCIRYGLTPRELGQTRIGELQQLLLKDDHYIPGVKNEDPLDLARKAKVSATSEMEGVDARPEYVIDGVARPEGACVHGWVSAPAQPLPQALRLDFPEPVTAREVRLAFDTNLTPKRVPRPYPPQLARAYRVEGLADGAWRTLAKASDNGLRHRIHRFEACRLEAVRVTVTATWGDPSARIFEVRVY